MPSARGATWWLELPDGSRRRIGAAGVLVGRNPDCDLVLTDDRASRRHAIVHATPEGPAVVSLGRTPVEVDGAADAPLADGARITMPGLTVTVVRSAPAEDDDPAWVLQHRGGGTFGVGDRGLSVGQGDEDDLRLPGCPAGAAVFHVVRGTLLVEAGTELTVSARRGDPAPLAVGSMRALRRGDVVGLGQAEIEVILGGRTRVGTTVGGDDVRPTEPTGVRLQFLPRGGRLYVDFAGETSAAYLAGRRCDLAACLLQPPAPYRPGEPIPDDVLIPRVWPGGSATRSNVGVLLHRLRRDLVQAGLDGCALIVRAEGGGATRFAIGDAVPVAVE